MARPGLRVLLAGDHKSLQGVANYLFTMVAAARQKEGKTSDPGVNTIILRLDAQLPLGPEGYTLESSPERIVITGNTPQGVFYGIQTLRQLNPVEFETRQVSEEAHWSVPALTIEDQPRFAGRGVLIDSARHFFPVNDIKRFIDAMALQKLNVLHWHLTDDQGWRIEIKKYPRLTEIGALRAESPKLEDQTAGDGKPYGGFYTQEEIRAVVAYAAERFITRLFPRLNCQAMRPLPLLPTPNSATETFRAPLTSLF